MRARAKGDTIISPRARDAHARTDIDRFIRCVRQKKGSPAYLMGTPKERSLERPELPQIDDPEEIRGGDFLEVAG